MSKEITAIIIDDMKLARASLKADLKEYCPEIKLIGEADSVVSGLKLLKKERPEILFLDIELEDGIGFDIIELLGDKLDAKVIFTTASNEYAIKAFQVAAVDYLLKPIDPDLLVKAVAKSKEDTANTKEQINILTDSLKSEKPSSKIALHTMDKIVISDIKDILRCEASGNYTTFFLRSGDKIMVTKTLKEYDEILSPHNFVRTHQSHLANANLVKEFVKTEGGYLIMVDESNVPVSVRKRAEVIQFLDQM